MHQNCFLKDNRKLPEPYNLESFLIYPDTSDSPYLGVRFPLCSVYLWQLLLCLWLFWLVIDGGWVLGGGRSGGDPRGAETGGWGSVLFWGGLSEPGDPDPRPGFGEGFWATGEGLLDTGEGLRSCRCCLSFSASWASRAYKRAIRNSNLVYLVLVHFPKL